MSNNETLSEWKVTTVKDEPVDDAKLLGLGPTVETLSRFFFKYFDFTSGQLKPLHIMKNDF